MEIEWNHLWVLLFCLPVWLFIEGSFYVLANILSQLWNKRTARGNPEESPRMPLKFRLGTWIVLHLVTAIYLGVNAVPKKANRSIFDDPPGNPVVNLLRNIELREKRVYGWPEPVYTTYVWGNASGTSLQTGSKLSPTGILLNLWVLFALLLWSTMLAEGMRKWLRVNRDVHTRS
ncbi:MAG TPA: hypothetical protein VEK08_22175 [Planctomycetota bacterium]|nr:hypothetical protein [Planctomycetota bacterium]